MQQHSGQVVAVNCDVSRNQDVERLANQALEAFGAVHVLCNNAGVADTSGASVWEASLADWEWVLGVNFWGVLYGDIAACVVDAIRTKRLYVLPHPEAIVQVRRRVDDIGRGSPRAD